MTSNIVNNGTHLVNYMPSDDTNATDVPAFSTILIRQLEYRDGMNVLGK